MEKVGEVSTSTNDVAVPTFMKLCILLNKLFKKQQRQIDYFIRNSTLLNIQAYPNLCTSGLYVFLYLQFYS
jgi:hypothetical protein